MTTAAEALVRDCANRLDQLFRQDYTMREVEAELRRLLRATQSNGRSPLGKISDNDGHSLRKREESIEGGESPAQSAPAQEPTITVSGPVACGKSYVMELIYKALRDAGLHPYSDELAHERRMVDEQPLPPAKVWKLRESIAAPQPDKARELLQRFVALVPDPPLVYSYDSPPEHRTQDEHELGYTLHLARAYLNKTKEGK